jgi:hypothetical protein
VGSTPTLFRQFLFFYLAAFSPLQIRFLIQKIAKFLNEAKALFYLAMNFGGKNHGRKKSPNAIIRAVTFQADAGTCPHRH